MPTQDRCSNCSCPPPCTWSLCIKVCPECSILGVAAGGATVRYEGPGGTVVTRTLGCDVKQDCYANPPEGDWTVTVSHPCHQDATATVTVVQCYSQTITLAPQLDFTVLHYSDPEVAFDFPLGVPPGDECRGLCSDTQSDYYTGTGYGPSGPYNCDCLQAGPINVQVGYRVDSTCGDSVVVTLERTIFLSGLGPGACEMLWDAGTDTLLCPILTYRSCSSVVAVTLDCASPTATVTFPACGPKGPVTATVSLS